MSKKRSEEERGVEEKERKKREMVKERRKTVLAVTGPLERTVSTAAFGELWDLSKRGTWRPWYSAASRQGSPCPPLTLGQQPHPHPGRTLLVSGDKKGKGTKNRP